MSPSPVRPLKALARYLACWLPIFGSYFFVLLGKVEGVGLAALEALMNVAPAAALGFGVWKGTRWLPWPTGGARAVVAFAATHVALALLYAVLWVPATWALMVLYSGSDFLASLFHPNLWWEVLMGVWLYGLVAGVSYAVRSVEAVRERERALEAAEAARARAEADRAMAELAALRAHLNPHFFFNTLHALGALVREDPRRAQRAVEAFGDLFRYVLRNDRERRALVRLSEELAFTRTYLDLEGLRLGDRLAVRWDVDEEALDAFVPPLLVQPLVENAVRHGLSPLRGGGTLDVRVCVASEAGGVDVLEVEVADDGAGADPDAALAGSGYGLRAIREQLAHQFGAAASVTVWTRPGEGFRVRARVPLVLTPPEHAPSRGAPVSLDGGAVRAPSA